MEKFKKAITNYKTLIAIVSQIGLIFGVIAPSVDWNTVTVVLTAIFTIAVYLGIVNKDGMETTKWNK